MRVSITYSVKQIKHSYRLWRAKIEMVPKDYWLKTFDEGNYQVIIQLKLSWVRNEKGFYVCKLRVWIEVFIEYS